MEPKILKKDALQRLQTAAYDPKRLVAIHAGIAGGVLLLVNILLLLLNRSLAQTGGLDGIGTRNLLSTAISLLQMAVMLATPVWAMGYTAALLHIARQQPATPALLPEGFRRFGPVLRLKILETGIYMLVAMVCIYPAMGIFSMLPAGQEFMEQLAPYMSGEISMDALSALEPLMLPLLLIFMGLFVLVALPISYRLRFSSYLVMDNPRVGGLLALIFSFRLTKSHWKSLLKLDLSYWWYFGLQLLIALAAYGDVVAAALGVKLPLARDVSALIFYALNLIAQFILAVTVQNRVETSYALLFCRAAALPPQEQPQPKNMPWAN